MPILIASYWLIPVTARGVIWAFGTSSSWMGGENMSALRFSEWMYPINHSQSWKQNGESHQW